MPVYNAAQYLDEAVESILGQTLRDFEFVIIDDGSTDASGEMLDGYAKMDGRITVFHQENERIVASLNLGLRASVGKYIARMDADDISVPERLETQVAFMERHPKVGLCGSACRLFGGRSGVTRPKTTSEEIKAWLLFGPGIAHPTVMMRRDLVIRHGLYYDSEFEQAEDYELWVRFAQHCEIANIPEPLLLYRMSENQATRRYDSEIRGWDARVQMKALGLLGIEPSDREMELHLSIRESRFPKSREYLEQFEAWLWKLFETNERNRVFESRAHAQVLLEMWRYVCISQPELGLWVWRRYVASGLRSVGGSISAGSDLSDLACFLRVTVSSRLEKTARGRSLKRLARSLSLRRCR
jgi:glycosyltransferase involved in cell wall biosynthesis